jgi:hypothetical protein
MDGRSTKSECLTGRPRQYYSFDHYEMHSWEETESLEEETGWKRPAYDTEEG